MRVGEHSHLAETAKLSVSAPRPSSAPFGGTCPYPLCPFGTFPPDRGNRPRGEGMGCLAPAGACKSHSFQPAEGASPSPTLRRKTYTRTGGPMWSSAPTERYTTPLPPPLTRAGAGVRMFRYAGVVEQVDTGDLKSPGIAPYGFDSRRRYQKRSTHAGAPFLHFSHEKRPPSRRTAGEISIA